jgi:hypothetical protein
MLYRLPSGLEHNADLRRCLSDFNWDYPATLANPLECVDEFREQNKDREWTYKGDLEADYLNLLANVQKAAGENPVDVEFDFP